MALLGDFSDGQSGFTAIMAATFAGLQADSGLTPAEVRARIIEEQPITSSQIYRRAHERGEIDLDRIPAAVLTMPFDLMRHDLLMTLTAIRRGTDRLDRRRPLPPAGGPVPAAARSAVLSLPTTKRAQWELVADIVAAW